MAILLKKMTIFVNFFEKMSSFWQFFDSQMAIFRRVSFPSKHRLRKVINRNTVKVGYSCTTSIENIVKSHNKKVLANSIPNSDPSGCKCRDESTCLLTKKCLNEAVVYKATVT